jgi:hypothetical protein
MTNQARLPFGICRPEPDLCKQLTDIESSLENTNRALRALMKRRRELKKMAADIRQEILSK